MLDDLHDRLWAEARRSVVLVLQGMDASGKDGTIRRVLTGLEPAGLLGRELQGAHHRRPRPRLPLAHPRQHAGAGDPRGLEPVALRGRRHRPVHRRHRRAPDPARGTGTSASSSGCCADEGITMVKVFLHISKEEQRARLQARIDDPKKNWKFRRADLDTRAQWDEYQTLLRRGDHRHVHDVGAVVRRPGRPQVGAGRRGGLVARRRARRRSTRRSPTRSPVSRASSSSNSPRNSEPSGPACGSIGQNGRPMDVESRDSVSLKPAELDELGQLVSGLGLPLQDEQLDTSRRAVPPGGSGRDRGRDPGVPVRVARAHRGHTVHPVGPRGRHGGARMPARASTASSPSCTAGPPSRSPTRTSSSRGGSRTRLRTRSSAVLDDVCPRPKYSPNGEERAWGRRLARRFGCDARYDDRSFRLERPRRARAGARTPRR